MEMQRLKNSGIGVQDVFNAYFAISAYKHSREEGKGVAVSTAKAVGNMVWTEMYFSTMNRGIDNLINTLPGIRKLPGIGKLGVQTALMFVPTLIGGGIQAYGAIAEQNTKVMEQGYAQKGKFGSGYFDMSEAGYTMRQRSLNAIRSNGLNTQSVFGNEARTYFRGVV